MNNTAVYAQNKVIIQQESYTCGPCALLNILSLKGDNSYNEKQLAKRCNAQSNIGTSHEDMVRVASEVGLQVTAEKEHATLNDIECHLDEGDYVIVNFINAFSGNGHYSVLVNHDEHAFYFRDSHLGLLRIKKVYFQKHWRSNDGIESWYMAVS